jgi:predicted metal-dependent peptidase
MEAADPSSLDQRTLGKLLDICMSSVFLHSGTAAFLGSIMSSLEFIWTRQLPSAATNGIHLYWNPDWFMQLRPQDRNTVLRHELWHVARLHMLRAGNRDPEVWNQACDYIINNDLKKEQCDFSFGGLVDSQYDDMAEEDVYDQLMAQHNGAIPNFGAWGAGMGTDMVPLDNAQKNQVIQKVVTAVQQAKLHGAGQVPGGITEMLDQFLKPVIPWQTVLQRWMSEMLEEDYTWAKPNRRFQDIYLPGRKMEMGRLENLWWYIDVSGSITTDHAIRFKSELKFVKDTFKPEKLSVAQFDTAIQRTDVWEEDDEFEKLEIIGRGGTSLDCVARHMLEEKPTAAIIFSDMECSPMDPTGLQDIPILWVCLPSRHGHKPVFGDVVEIQE